MGFEGHIFDMIRRNKANREMIDKHRRRIMEIRERLSEPSLSLSDADEIQKELDEIEIDVARKERDEQIYYVRSLIVIGGISIVVMYFVILAFKIYVL